MLESSTFHLITYCLDWLYFIFAASFLVPEGFEVSFCNIFAPGQELHAEPLPGVAKAAGYRLLYRCAEAVGPFGRKAVLRAS
jgi:hypothetical protein